MIDIIIVNWNSGAQLAQCLVALGEHSQGLVRSIIIVDNASDDGSLDALAKNGIETHIIRNDENLGFGVACNQGADLAKGEFVLFLNPDTIIHAGALQVPHNFMTKRKNRDVGICGVQMVDENGNVLRHCARFPSLSGFLVHALGLSSSRYFARFGIHMQEWDHLDTRLVQQVIGAFFFVRRSLFRDMQGFDPRFFVYFEEVDFSYRSSLAGWKSYYLADAKIFHACGGTSRQIKARRLFYSLRSRMIYGQKHFSRTDTMLLYLITLGLEPLARLAQALHDGNPGNAKVVLRAYGMLLRSMPRIWKSGRGPEIPAPHPTGRTRQ